MNLAEARTALYAALEDIDAEVYRLPRSDYQYPAVVIGYPLEMDVRPVMASARDMVIPLTVAVEATDDNDADDVLSDTVDAVVEALSDAAWDPRPAEFNVELTNDGRVVVSCQIPVAVFA